MSSVSALASSRLGCEWLRKSRSASSTSQRANCFDWNVGVGGAVAARQRQLRMPAVASSSPTLSAPAAPHALLSSRQGWHSVCRAQAHPRKRAALCVAAAAATAAAAPAASPLVSSLAVLVGWLVIAGSCIRSLPQILRILKNKSVRGLSLTSFSSELLCYMVSVAYNISNGYAFSTFGDTAICALQNIAIVGFIFRLGSVARGTQLVLTASLAGAGWWLFSGRCPPALLTTLQTGSVVLLALGGRLPQILLNLRRGNSGELSLLTCALSLAGNLARVFTTLTLVGDPLILGSAATQAILNGILTWQTIDTARRLRAGTLAAAA